VTVKDQDGEVVFSKEKEYAVYDFHFAHNKDGYIGLDHWDITAMDHIDLGLEPGKTDSLTFVVLLNEDTKSVEIEVAFKYVYEPGQTAVIHKETKKIDF
jgi:hypothetical protein